MKKLFIAALVVSAAVVVPLKTSAQVNEQLQEFMQTLQIDGLPLVTVHMNDRTTALLFQPPTLYAMRAKAKEVTCFYVQGVTEKAIELDTNGFTIEEQGRPSASATPISMHNFTKGKLKLNKGERVDGVLTFNRLVDVNRSFIFKYGKAMVEFRLADTVKDMTAPVAK